jgi:hypothetical protein
MGRTLKGMAACAVIALGVGAAVAPADAAWLSKGQAKRAVKGYAWSLAPALEGEVERASIHRCVRFSGTKVWCFWRLHAGYSEPIDCGDTVTDVDIDYGALRDVCRGYTRVRYVCQDGAYAVLSYGRVRVLDDARRVRCFDE